MLGLATLYYLARPKSTSERRNGPISSKKALQQNGRTRVVLQSQMERSSYIQNIPSGFCNVNNACESDIPRPRRILDENMDDHVEEGLDSQDLVKEIQGRILFNHYIDDDNDGASSVDDILNFATINFRGWHRLD